jgi:hypothetical protein
MHRPAAPETQIGVTADAEAATACPNHLGTRKTVLLSIGLGIVASIWVLSLIPVPPSVPGGDKWHHWAAYAGCTFWWCSLLTLPKNRIALVGGFALMGAVIEVLQGMTGYRYFEWADMAANALGVFTGAALAHLLPIKHLKVDAAP